MAKQGTMRKNWWAVGFPDGSICQAMSMLMRTKCQAQYVIGSHKMYRGCRPVRVKISWNPNG